LGSFVGEGDCQDGIRRDASILNHVGDAISNGPGLAAAGASQHQHRTFDSLGGFALLGIEFV